MKKMNSEKKNAARGNTNVLKNVLLIKSFCEEIRFNPLNKFAQEQKSCIGQIKNIWIKRIIIFIA